MYAPPDMERVFTAFMTENYGIDAKDDLNLKGSMKVGIMTNKIGTLNENDTFTKFHYFLTYIEDKTSGRTRDVVI
jgi:hypothetical protein